MTIRHVNRRPKKRESVNCSSCAHRKFGKDHRTRRSDQRLRRETCETTRG